MMIAASCAGSAPKEAAVPEVEINDGVMTPEVLLAFGRLSDPQLSPDGSKILYGVSYQNIKENNSLRNIYICNTDGSGKVRLTNEKKSVSCARWSKDGKDIYFLQGGQLYKAPFKAGKLGKKVKLSDIPSGIGEFKISPDGQQIIYTSTIKNPAVVQPADTDPTLDKAQAYTTENLMYRHWDHWVTEIPRSYVATLVNGTITPDNSLDILGPDNLFELPTEPFGGVEQLDWAPDSRHIAYSCRKKTGTSMISSPARQPPSPKQAATTPIQYGAPTENTSPGFPCRATAMKQISKDLWSQTSTSAWAVKPARTEK